MTTDRHLLAVVLGVLLVGPALAQPGGAGCCAGMRMGPDNSAGWSMMTPQERQEHQAKVAGLKSMDDCKAYMSGHHAKMAERAKHRGAHLAEPRHSMCAPTQGAAPPK